MNLPYVVQFEKKKPFEDSNFQVLSIAFNVIQCPTLK